MSESILREFVREMLLEAKKKEAEEAGDSLDMPSRYGGEGYLPSDVLPYGQDYITDEEQEEREAVSDEYIVSYKGDLGYGSYNARPRKDTALAEIALRRVIREEAKKLLSNEKDSKKKMMMRMMRQMSLAGLQLPVAVLQLLSVPALTAEKVTMTELERGLFMLMSEASVEERDRVRG